MSTEREVTIAMVVDNIYIPGLGTATMTIYLFRVWLHPNPPLGFEPDDEVRRDIEIDGSHTLAEFHEAIDLQSNPPPEGNAAETTIGELDPDTLGALSYTFDMGDNWEHYIELQDTREGSLDGDPLVVDEQGAAPPQYPDLDEQ